MTPRRHRLLLVASLIAISTIALLTAGPAWAEVKLAPLFTDHAVLQRDMPVPIWGWAEPGEEVTVTLAGQEKTAKADNEGHWKVRLEKMPAGGPHELKVADGSSIQLADILVGEVWLASGQSNMAWPVSRANNFPEEQKAAKYPEIRMFTVARQPADEPQSKCNGQWVVCSPETVGGFSATAYFFGRELHKELDVPVGLINTSWGGTPIQSWTSMPAMEKVPEIKEAVDEWMSRKPPHRPACLFNGMVAPLVPYALRGGIWYQGESNAGRYAPHLYGSQLATMIGDWRSRWEQGDFPFIHVQLPNFKQPQKNPVEDTGWVTVRDGMRDVLRTVPNTGMAITLDIGEAGDIHPRNKQDVGRRLAAWALANTYDKDVVASGPLFTGHEKQGDKIVLKFDHVGKGLKVKGEKLEGFAIKGAEGDWVWAEAEITGPHTVTVSSPQVDNPAAVRYAWADNPKATLFNSADLPAAPLKTDR